MKNSTILYLILLSFISLIIKAQNGNAEKPKICTTSTDGYLIGGKIALGPPLSCLSQNIDSTQVSISNVLDINLGEKITNPIIYLKVGDDFNFNTATGIKLVDNKAIVKIPVGKNWILMQGEIKGQKYLTCSMQENLSSNEPEIKSSICQDQKLVIKLNESKNNNFDIFTIDWGNGEKEEINITSRPLPITISKNISINQQVTIKGDYVRFNTKVCPSRSKKIIPNQKKIITSLEFVNEGTQANFNFNGYLSNEPFDILVKRDNGDLNEKWIKMGSGTGSIGIVSNLNLEINYCFRTKSIDNCGVEEYSFNTICDPNLKVLNNINSIPTLGWKPQKVQNTFLKKTLLRLGSLDCCLTTLILQPSDSVFTHKNIDCSKIYFYQVINILNETDYEDKLIDILITSKKIKIDMNIDYKNYTPNNPTIIDFDSNLKTKIEIQKQNQEGVSKYILFKSASDGKSFNQISSSSENTFVQTIGDLGSYCYKFKIEDKCGKISDYSNPICTIKLSISNQNILKWSNYFESLNTSPQSTKIKYSVEYFNASEKTFLPFYNTADLAYDLSNYIPKSNENKIQFRILAKLYLDTLQEFPPVLVHSYSNILEYKIITGLNYQNPFNSFSIFPNPGKGTFQIKLQNFPKGKVEMKLSNQNGKILLKKIIYENETFFENLEFDINNLRLSTGLYFIKLTSGNISETRKLLIE